MAPTAASKTRAAVSAKNMKKGINIGIAACVHGSEASCLIIMVLVCVC